MLSKMDTGTTRYATFSRFFDSLAFGFYYAGKSIGIQGGWARTNSDMAKAFDAAMLPGSSKANSVGNTLRASAAGITVIQTIYAVACLYMARTLSTGLQYADALPQPDYFTWTKPNLKAFLNHVTRPVATARNLLQHERSMLEAAAIALWGTVNSSPGETLPPQLPSSMMNVLQGAPDGKRIRPRMEDDREWGPI